MSKTARQLDREIAEALGGGSAPSRTPPPHARFTVHGARRGVNKVEHVDTRAEADRVARALAKKDFLVTVFTRDPHTQETRVVLHSNRDEAGRMKFTVMDESFARAARVRR